MERSHTPKWHDLAIAVATFCFTELCHCGHISRSAHCSIDCGIWRSHLANDCKSYAKPFYRASDVVVILHTAAQQESGLCLSRDYFLFQLPTRRNCLRLQSYDWQQYRESRVANAVTFVWRQEIFCKIRNHITSNFVWYFFPILTMLLVSSSTTLHISVIHFVCTEKTSMLIDTIACIGLPQNSPTNTFFFVIL